MALLEEQISACVEVRDAGDPQRAKASLEAILAVAPNHPRATIELLVIAVMGGPSDLPDRIAASLSPELAAHPHVRLLLAKHHQQHDRLPQVAQWLQNVDQAAILPYPSFQAILSDLLAALSNYSIGLTAPLTTILLGNDVEQARLTLAVQFLRPLVLNETDPNRLLLNLHRWTFLTPNLLHLRADLFGQLLLAIPDEAPTEILSTAFAYLVATRRWAEARGFADRLLARPDAATDPVFAKAMVGFATEADPAFALISAHVSAACSAAQLAPQRPEHRRASARLNSIEVRARQMRRLLQAPAEFAATGALAPTYTGRTKSERQHVYAGLFGQLRFSNEVLAPAAAYLHNELAGVVARGGQLSCGVATWQESGQRELRAEDGIPFLIDLLPLALGHEITRRDLTLVSEAAGLIPNICQRLMLESRRTNQINVETIRTHFAAEAFVSIEKDETFRKEFGDHLAATLGNSVPLVNQGRMWNRIAAHRSLIECAEAAAGAPVTHAILMRTDLIGLSGSLWQQAETQISLGTSNWAVFDHDSHATFIEGVGDRFMVVDREALDRLLDGYELMRSIIAPGTTIDPTYRTRFVGHTLLRTILFEHGTKIHEALRSTINFDIFRGRRTVAQLRDEIAHDAVQSADPELGRVLASLTTGG